MRNSELARPPFVQSLQQMVETVDQLEITWEFLDLSSIRRAIDRTLSKLDESESQSL